MLKVLFVKVFLYKTDKVHPKHWPESSIFSNISAGNLREIDFVLFLRFENLTNLALLQFTYSSELCFSQNTLSSFSFLN